MSAESLAVILIGADDIVAELGTALSDGKFTGLHFTPERTYAEWKTHTLSDVDCLHVDVLPVQHEKDDLDDRESIGYVCSYDVGARFKFGTSDAGQSGRTRQQEIDRLVLFIEELHEFFCMKCFENDEVWFSAKIHVSFSPFHLREWNMFLGIVRVQLYLSKELDQ